MVPWRATEDGVVTPEVLEWYARFADGQAGRAGRGGHRHSRRGQRSAAAHRRRPVHPGLRTLVETVREHSQGRTRLFIQCIDFLAVRRRPEPRNSSGASLDVDAALRQRLAAASASRPGWRRRSRAIRATCSTPASTTARCSSRS